MVEGNQNKDQNSALDAWLKRKKPESKQVGIQPVPDGEPLLASFGQERLWLLEQLYPKERLYNYAHQYTINGNFDLTLFQKAIIELSGKHQILRSNFIQESDRLTISISDRKPLISFNNLSQHSEEVKAELLEKQSTEFINRTFKLESEPLFRISIFELGNASYEVFFVLHHIVGDAWSMGIINESLSKAYLAKDVSVITSPSIQYHDYSYWQRNKGYKTSDLDYWKDRLSGDLGKLEIPRKEKYKGESFNGGSAKAYLSKELKDKLEQLASSQGTTMYVVVLAAYKILLARYSGASDVVVGSPFSNRDFEALESVIGFFNETLVLRTNIDKGSTFVEIIDRVKEVTMEGLTHKNLPFDVLVNELKIERQVGENPLFQTMFLYNTPPSKLNLGPDILVKEQAVGFGLAKFDLTLFANEVEDGLELLFEYNLKLDENVIGHMVEHFKTLLLGLLENSDQPIAKALIYSNEQRGLLSRCSQGKKIEFENWKSIHQLILSKGNESPDKIAISFLDQSITYRRLKEWSAQVASDLKNSGVKKGDFVGILSPRSIEMVVGILGVLRAGAAYLPLDPEYPLERLQYMLNDTDCKVTLGFPGLEMLNGDEFKHLEIEFDENHEIETIDSDVDQSNDPAYIIYTSGSSGTPKGVSVNHGNLLHSTLVRSDFFEDRLDSFLLMSSFSFDSSVVGVFWSLCNGAKLVLPPPRIEQDIDQLCKLIHTEEVTHTLMLPSLYQVIISLGNHKLLKSLKAIMVAGEACSLKLKDLHFDSLPTTRLYNEYGPTETTVWCVAHQFASADTSVVIGKPIPNVNVLVLDSDMNLSPMGMPGELCIGGKGVTQGYHNRPELTREKFIPHPEDSGQGKVYRTGDLVRFNSQGQLIFLGRVDNQVKIRGHRVELDEIRNRILEFSTVNEAIIRAEKDNRLFAWVESHDITLPDNITAALRDSLPGYMVPERIVLLREFPKLPNGKIDLQKLPLPNPTSKMKRGQNEPIDDKEKILLDIWREILQIEDIDTYDNFFEVGGDSILSIRIIAKAKESGLRLKPTDIFEYQNIKSLTRQAQMLTPKTGNVETNHIKNNVDFPLSFQQKAFLFHSIQRKSDEGLLHLQFELEGVLNPRLMRMAWQLAMDNHPVLRTSLHWQNEEEPFQTIHLTATLNWTFKDLSQKIQPSEELDELLIEDKADGINLSEPGHNKFSLIKLNDSSYRLLWTCHHILIDGWSGAIIFKDALEIYSSLNSGSVYIKPRIVSFSEYLEWKLRQNINDGLVFFERQFSCFSAPLFSREGLDGSSDFLNDIERVISTDRLEQIQQLAKKEKVAISSIFQTIWLITLSRFFETSLVSTGLTVTGRSVDFDGIESLAGPLMNVLPFKAEIEEGAGVWELLKQVQNNLNQLRSYEYLDLGQISKRLASEHKPLFDNLFVFGNFMSGDTEVAGICIKAFKGDFTSTYPVTFRVNPTEELELNIRFNSSVISPESAEWLMSHVIKAIETLLKSDLGFLKIQDLLSDTRKPSCPENKIKIAKEPILEGFDSVQNGTQLELLKLWEKIIGKGTIGIHESYFKLGGTSIGALQLFSDIHEVFGKKLPVTSLIEHPTIAGLSQLISGKEEDSWNSIIPMKTKGNAPPIFCLHSGGAHVLFYRGLAQYLPDSRPVYAVQPTSVGKEQEGHKNIHEMASDYIMEIKKIQPEGPYHLVSTCFGNAVGVEISHQLNEKGENVEVLYVVDSAPAYLFPPSPNGERKPVSRMLSMIKKGNWNGIFKKFKNRYVRLNKQLVADKRNEHEIELDEIVDSLNDIYTRYSWKPIEDKVVLIRSSQFSERKDKKFHLERWNHLSQGRLEVYRVEGHHTSLFEEPEVKHLAGCISAHLESLETQRN